jgi:hypothetical protein
MQCKYIKTNGDQCKLITCNSAGICHLHKCKVGFEKPAECGICRASIHQTTKPLDCGHWFHKSCLYKAKIVACPYCNVPIQNVHLDKIVVPTNFIELTQILYKIYLLQPNPKNYTFYHFINGMLDQYISIQHPAHQDIARELYYTFLYEQCIQDGFKNLDCGNDLVCDS